MDELHFNGASDGLYNDTTFTDLEEKLKITAHNFTHSCRNQRDTLLRSAPVDVLDARAASRAAPKGSETLRLCRRHARKVTRKWKAVIALANSSKKKRNQMHVPEFFKVDGVEIHDRTLWPGIVADHCRDKYEDISFTDSDASKLLDDLRTDQKNIEMLGHISPPKHFSDVAAARARLNKNKVNGGGSETVAEWIFLLPITVMYLIFKMMRDRYTGETTEVIDSRRNIILTFLEKTAAKSVGMKHFRGICLLDLVAKWYMSCVLLIMERQHDPFKMIAANSAYSTGISIVHVALLLLQHVLRVSYDWRRSVKAVIAQGDIEGAFDNARIALLSRALKARKTPPARIAADV